jgi:Ca2+-binding RTX toxin-like protein
MAGNDVLRGGLGDDALNGGAGSDWADYSTASNEIAVNLTALEGNGEGHDTLVGVENVRGSSHGNVMVGDEHANVLIGGIGMDRLVGGAGDDRLVAGNANDVALGGAGHDTLIGGSGADVLMGGGSADIVQGNRGADIFVYNSAAESALDDYDTNIGFDAHADVFDVGTAIAAIDPAITTGELSFDALKAGLRAALNKHVFGSDHAILFTPDSGDLAGHTFLAVGLDGRAGFSGADLLVYLEAPAHLRGLDAANFT